MYTTSKLVDAAIKQERHLNAAGFNDDHRAAINLTDQMAQCLGFCYRTLRGKQGTFAYNDYEINVGSMAGRTMISVIKGNEYVSFVGASSGVKVECQALSVDSLDGLLEFSRTIEGVTEVCTEEMMAAEPTAILPAQQPGLE